MDRHHIWINERIQKRKELGTLRSLRILPNDKIDFISNDYLGIITDNLLRSASTLLGSGGSRLVSGNHPFHEKFESECCDRYLAEAALLFNSGYDANLSLLSCLPHRHDIVFYDEYCHASIIDGIKLSGVKAIKFKHNHLEDLKFELKSTVSERKWVICEALYSMDGDLAPLAELVEICIKHEAALIVDEAHSNGIYGSNGEGLVATLGLANKVFARIMTFGKAPGSHGAVILGSLALKTYLVNFARSFVYSTGPSPAHTSLLLSYLSLDMSNQRKQLFRNIDLFNSNMKAHSPDMAFSNSPIKQLIVPDFVKLKLLESILLENGILTKAIFSPTVPIGKEQLRICLHSFNTNKEITLLTDILKQNLV